MGTLAMLRGTRPAPLTLSAAALPCIAQKGRLQQHLDTE